MLQSYFDQVDVARGGFETGWMEKYGPTIVCLVKRVNPKTAEEEFLLAKDSLGRANRFFQFEGSSRGICENCDGTQEKWQWLR